MSIFHQSIHSQSFFVCPCYQACFMYKNMILILWKLVWYIGIAIAKRLWNLELVEALTQLLLWKLPAIDGGAVLLKAVVLKNPGVRAFAVCDIVRNIQTNFSITCKPLWRNLSKVPSLNLLTVLYLFSFACVSMSLLAAKSGPSNFLI